MKPCNTFENRFVWIRGLLMLITILAFCLPARDTSRKQSNNSGKRWPCGQVFGRRALVLAARWKRLATMKRRLVNWRKSARIIQNSFAQDLWKKRQNKPALRVSPG